MQQFSALHPAAVLEPGKAASDNNILTGAGGGDYFSVTEGKMLFGAKKKKTMLTLCGKSRRFEGEKIPS